MDIYRPVSCSLHSACELAIMRQQRLWVLLVDGRQLEGVGSDMRSRNGAEFLLLRLDDGGEEALRLDHLVELRLATTGELLV